MPYAIGGHKNVYTSSHVLENKELFIGINFKSTVESGLFVTPRAEKIWRICRSDE